MEIVFGNCVVGKRQNDGSSSMSLGHGKRSRPCYENVDNSDVLVSLETQLDAFACPGVSAEEGECPEFLTTTMKLPDEAKVYCDKLQDQLRDKEKYYLKREKELKEFHRSELERESIEFEEALKANYVEISQKNRELCAAEEREMKLNERFREMEISEQKLHEQLKSVENSYAAHLKDAIQGQQQYLDHINMLTEEIEALRASNGNRECELREQLNVAQDEISALRAALLNNNKSLYRNSSISSPPIASAKEVAHLECEVDSLRCVLELKQKDISKLSKDNEKLMRDAEERTVLIGKILKLESCNEMLKSELELTKELLKSERELKSRKEKDFLHQIEDLQKTYNHEKGQKQRLSYDNEALQYQLKQRSEQLHIVETKLQELSAMQSHNASIDSSSLNRSQLLNGSSLAQIQMDDFPSPTIPEVKNVIEKPDAVSWVLEMDDFTPEAAASKILKRACSFRSVERSPCPLTRRRLSLNCVRTPRHRSGKDEELAVEGRRDSFFQGSPICSTPGRKRTASMTCVNQKLNSSERLDTQKKKVK